MENLEEEAQEWATQCLDSIVTELGMRPMTEDWFNTMPMSANALFMDIVHAHIKGLAIASYENGLNSKNTGEQTGNHG